MRNTLRLLAAVKPGRYLEAGNPTGLTGLFTHPAPRSALLYLYSATLDQLKAFPEHSVYRQSTEALTRHRMKIIESIIPEGYDEWAKRSTETIKKYPKAFQPGGNLVLTSAGGQDFVMVKPESEDEETKNLEDQLFTSQGEVRDEDDDGRYENGVEIDDDFHASQSMGKTKKRPVKTVPLRELRTHVKWEPEPPLEASQISDAENQIGGGLIEEVIQVAEGELKLVKTMAESKVWEELEEKPLQGQWDSFTRDQHTRGTQEPPNK